MHLAKTLPVVLKPTHSLEAQPLRTVVTCKSLPAGPSLRIFTQGLPAPACALRGALGDVLQRAVLRTGHDQRAVLAVAGLRPRYSRRQVGVAEERHDLGLRAHFCMVLCRMALEERKEVLHLFQPPRAD